MDILQVPLKVIFWFAAVIFWVPALFKTGLYLGGWLTP